jgi:uncharacterized protein (TIGR02996 family)
LLVADLAALLSAIYERPDDDALRSVYADALQDAGDPRGEFIALQLKGVSNGRTKQLASRWAQVWLGELAPIVITSDWKRGFADAVVVDIFKKDLLARLANRREWTTIRTIELGGTPTSGVRMLGPHQKAAIRALVKSPGAAGRRFRPSLAEVEAAIDRGELLR